jgi:hypothetical protein
MDKFPRILWSSENKDGDRYRIVESIHSDTKGPFLSLEINYKDDCDLMGGPTWVDKTDGLLHRTDLKHLLEELVRSVK